MKYRIGIDLGTNSLGWAAIRLIDKDDSTFMPGPLLDMGVRIFSDARNPKDKSSNAAQRRGPRGMRRNRDRRLARGQAMMHALVAAGLMPTDKVERKALEKLDPWVLRADALDRQLEPYEVGRALFHLQQRRGFKSNRKTDGAEDGAMFDAIEKARERLYLEDARTLGELFGRPRREQQAANNTAPRGEREPLPQARVKARKQGSKMAYDYYPDRAMILDEFDSIWEKQASFHSGMMTEAALENVRRVISHQRPLKSQKAGKCTFLEKEPRAPKALPSSQHARILQEVLNLRIGAPGDGKRALSAEERSEVIAFLRQPSSKTAKRTFKAIRKKLGIPESQTFSHESHKRDHLVGDLTAATMMQKDAYGPEWCLLSRADQDALILRLLESEQFEAFGSWAMERFGIDEEKARAVFKTRLPDAHGKLSMAALYCLIPRMEAGTPYDAAAAAEFGDHRSLGDGVVHEDGLPYYGKALSRHTAFEKDYPDNDEERYGRVANPTVHVALNELRKVINDLIKRYGPPTQVVLELARDLPLSDRGLKDLEKRQKDNQDANDTRRKELEKLGATDSYDNRLKLRLYEEALEAFDGVVVCVFTGKTINKTDLFNGDIEVEHILPLSRTLDDSFANKVLATREANRLKQNRTPSEACDACLFDREQMGQFVAQLPASKQWRFDPDAMERWGERGGFLDRQLNDTRYIARLGKSFVEALYGGQGMAGQDRNVWAVPGRLTSDLRHFAGFNGLLRDDNRKDRTDHRHHAVDALVVALTDHTMIKRAADLAKQENRLAHYEIMSEMAEPLKRYRKSAEDRLSKLVVSHKPDHGFQDAMHNDTAYGITGVRDDKKQMILVTRKPLDALEPKQIADVVDPVIRRHLAYATDGLSGTAFKEEIVRAGARMTPPVRRVRVTTPMKDTSYVTIRHGADGQHAKAYKSDGNYCYDVFIGKEGKWEGEVITTFEAYQRAQENRTWWQKPERADGSPLIMRIRKGDMLEIDDGDGRKCVIVYKFSEGRVNMAEHFQADASARIRARDLQGYQMAPSSLQKARAVRLTVSPSGRVKRHKA